MVLQHAILAFSIAAILAPFSYYAGLGAKLLRLPQLTGYLISGIVCGPYLLGILSSESVLDLNIIEGTCLSIIGLAAGAELDWPSLSRARKQVLGITAGICIATWLLCYGALDWLALSFPYMPETDSAHLAAVATLGATLMMTRSPASAIAVLKEVEARGPFCSLVMAVVVVKDVVVIMAFALNLELIRGVFLPAHQEGGGGLQLLAVLMPFISVLLSMAVGAFGGLLLGVALRAPRGWAGPGAAPSSLLPSTSLGGGGAGGAGGAAAEQQLQHFRSKMLVVVVVSSAVFHLAHYFEAEPLLACVTMGMVVVNRRHERAEREKEELHALVTQVMSVTNVAFFGLAGASLKLTALKDMLVPALVVCGVRLVAIYTGSWLGCYTTGTLAEFRRMFWASMVTQAGVAMGLARLAGTRFPEWGPHFQTFMMAIILVNLLLGPPLFRWALVRVGEVRGGAGIGLAMSAAAGAGAVMSGAKSIDLGELAAVGLGDRGSQDVKENHDL